MKLNKSSILIKMLDEDVSYEYRMEHNKFRKPYLGGMLVDSTILYNMEEDGLIYSKYDTDYTLTAKGIELAKSIK